MTDVADFPKEMVALGAVFRSAKQLTDYYQVNNPKYLVQTHDMIEQVEEEKRRALVQWAREQE